MRNDFYKGGQTSIAVKTGTKAVSGMSAKLGLWLLVLCVLAVYIMPVQASAETQDLQLGSKGTAFKAGESYLVPLALKNASDTEQDSVAAAAPGKFGKLTISPDGTTADLEVELRSVTMGSIIDYAENFFIYQKTKASGAKEAATIVTTQNVVAKDGKKETKKTVPQTIKFAIPTETMATDGVFLKMYVAAMGASPTAFLQVEYDKAVSIDDESMNYTTDAASVKVPQFGSYDVDVQVDIKNGKINDVMVQGKNFKGHNARENQSYLQKAANGMKAKLQGLYKNDQKKIEEVDIVTKATYSSKVIRKGTMMALGMNVDEETEPTVPNEPLEPGFYSIGMKNVTSLVEHSLIGGDDGLGYLRVDNSGKMWLTYKMISGTETSPFYVLGYNGYYNDADILTKNKATCETETMDVPTMGEKAVVTTVTMPLTSMKESYKNNVHLFVEAMKDVDSGKFKKGEFDVNSTITLDWQSIDRFSADGDKFASLTDGVYLVKGEMKQLNKTEPSMSNKGINHNIKLTVKNGVYIITMDLNGIMVGSDRGYLKDMKYFDSGFTVDKKGNPKGSLKSVKILDYQMNKDGSRLKDKLGSDYPNHISFPMVREVLGNDQFIPLQMFIPIMENITPGTGTKKAYLKLNKASVKKTTDNDPGFKENEPRVKPPKKITKKVVKGVTYKVVGSKAVVEKATNSVKSVSIGATVKIGKKNYKVTEIKSGVFKNKKNLQTVVVEKNVKIIGSKVFYGDKKLKKITFKGTNLQKIGKQSFKGVYKKIVFRAPKSKLKKYKSLIKKAGAPKKAKYKKA